MPELGFTNLTERMEKRLAVERYFESSGRTLRKGRARVWFNEEIKPPIMKALFRLLGLYARGQRNALAIQTREVEFSLKRLPKRFDGFTMLHISDFHIDKVDGLAEALARAIRPLRPDVCVFTGDYRFEIRGSCAEVYPRMSTVLESIHAALGTFAILGNHDSSEIAHWLDRQGVRMLMNDAVEIERGGERIWIAGTDDPYDYRCADIRQALRNVPRNDFKVLLTHTPSLYEEAAGAGVDLYLCGHTHAGQIRLPFVGSLKKNGPFPRKYAQGCWVYNRMHAYTSWGAGCSTLPVRFHCPPEVTLIRLRTE